MTRLSRRHTIAGLGAVVAASATRSRSAKAAEPVTVWGTQGFYEAENKTVIDDLAAWDATGSGSICLALSSGQRKGVLAQRASISCADGTQKISTVGQPRELIARSMRGAAHPWHARR